MYTSGQNSQWLASLVIFIQNWIQ